MMRFVFFLSFGACALINLVTLKNGHNWGGDFSQYILHAQNILGGKTYNSGIMIDNPIVYPPGFPLLLVPLVQLFGVNFLAFKFLNILFWLGGLTILYVMAQRKEMEGNVALVLTLLAASSFFFIFKQNVLADVPFFFFVILSSYTLLQYEDSTFAKRWFAVHLGCIAFAFLVRSAGLSLFLASALYLGIKGKRKEALSVGVVLAAMALLQAAWIGTKAGFFATLLSAPWDLALRIFHLGPVVFKSCVWFFFANCPEKMSVTFISWIVYGALFGFFVYKLRKTQISYWGCFAFFYTIILIIWSATYPMAPDGFVRYVLPLMPPLLLWFANWGKIFAKAILVILILLNIFNISKQFDFNDDIIYRKENQEMFAWLKMHLKADEHYMFWEPRPLALMTGRTGTVHWRSPVEQAQWFERMKALDISYVIAIKAVDAPLMGALDGQPNVARAVWENSEFKIYKTF